MENEANEKAAKEALRLWLMAWKKQDLQELFDRSTKTYQHINTDLDYLLGKIPYQLEKYKVTHFKADTECLVRVSIQAYHPQGEDTIELILVKEIAPYHAGPRGKWGVNPKSLKKLK